MNNSPFTQRSQAALRLAQESSAQLGHGYVGSEHLLLGLLKEGQGVASKVLKQDPRSMECAGSLTPELEGAARSASHPRRVRPVKTAPQAEKGGAKDE